ncbi:MAG: Gfo/Idh/MocA family oxidoreductase [Pseudomonadota bacterium]
MSKLRLGVIGAGMGAKPHGRALADLRDRVEVTGVFSRTSERRETFAAEHGFPVAAVLNDLIDDSDAILLLTPPVARTDILTACAEAGKHVLCEKPLERTAEAAGAIVETFDAKGLKLGVVFQHRYRHGSRVLARMIGNGDMGAILAVEAQVPWWRDQSYYDEPGRGTYARDGGGVLISQAIHTLDLMLSLTGPVSEVQAMTATTGFHQMEAEDFAAAALRFANGAVGSIIASTAAYPGGAESIRLHCAKATATLQAGTLRLDWHDRAPEEIGEPATTGGGADPMAFPHDWHRDLIAGFVDAVATDRDPVPSGRDALAVQRLIDAMVASSMAGARMTVET